jgi:hypothetical protein
MRFQILIERWWKDEAGKEYRSLVTDHRVDHPQLPEYVSQMQGSYTEINGGPTSGVSRLVLDPGNHTLSWEFNFGEYDGLSFVCRPFTGGQSIGPGVQHRDEDFTRR